MSDITTKEREELPAWQLGEPETLGFPVRNQEDLDAAAHLLGKAKDPEKVKARLIAAAKRLDLKLPDSWAAEMSAGSEAESELCFDSTPADDGFLYSGPIFKAGNYKDKNLNVTEEDLSTIVRNFKPAPLRFNHDNSVLDPALDGYQLLSVWKKGDELHGLAKFPQWLHSALKTCGNKVKVSVGVLRDFSAVKELSLTPNPRISDAQLLAAFQEEFAGKRNSAPDQAMIQRMHDLTVSLGASCDGGADEEENDDNDGDEFAGKQKPMKKTLLAKFQDLWAKNPAILEEAGISAAELDDAPAEGAIDTEMREKLAKFEAELARNREVQLRQAAVSFAEGVIRSGKAVPAMAESIAALFCQAAKADNDGVAQFDSNGEAVEGENLKALKALFDSAPKHSLFEREIRSKLPKEDADIEASKQMIGNALKGAGIKKTLTEKK